MTTIPSLPLEIPDLRLELWSLLEQVPRGCVTTYGELAKALGSSTAARWIGEVMTDHQHTDACRCHCVVRHTGELGRFISNDSRDKQQQLLSDGVHVSNNRVDLEVYRFGNFESRKPPSELADHQAEIANRVRFEPLTTSPGLVGGVDLSYRPPDIAVAAFALVDVTSGELIWSTTITRKVEFPYISGFLSYRELPVLLDLLNEVQDQDKLPQFLLVDGNGILHQRGAGIASHLGVLADLVTVGVGKSLLCGSVNVSQMQGRETRPIVYNERTVGMAFKWKTQSKPLYVSPGHRIDVDGAVRLVSLLSLNHKLPEPIYYADSLSRATAQE